MKTTIITLVICLLAILNLQAQSQTTIPDKPEVILVQGGTFAMGSTVEEDETPHTVTLSNYSIGKYPVTVGQYKTFCTATGTTMPEAPSWGWQDKHPMVNVTYNDAVSYCNWLGETYGGDWRLPTEAQWEFAARGGTKSNKYTYSGSDDLDEVAWYADNAGGKTQSVGRKKANELSLYDMSGNVWEWCKDWYDKDYYASSPSTNPKGATSGANRVLRGGSWYYSATRCRVAYRGTDGPSYRSSFNGFRVALSQ
ncbi:MAG: sulfatase modifying factor 1 [Flavobacteriales bacterium]|jgi:sulfatase modifying factor 1